MQQAEEAYKNAVADKTRDSEGQKQMSDDLARLQNELKERDAERDAAQDANEDAKRALATIKAPSATTPWRLSSKAKAGQQEVDKLVAENAALTAKLNEAEKNIASLNANGPAKDAQIASLKKDLADAREQLTAALKQSQENLNQMNDLQDQVERATTEHCRRARAARGKLRGGEKALPMKMNLLRGIVVRERNAEAYRDQQKQLALAELKKLQVPSDSPLVARINDIAQPVLKLTDAGARFV